MPEPETRNYYIDEQLDAAIDYLTSGRERIKERLEAIASTRLAVLHLEEFPGPLQELAATIFRRLEASESEGSYAASIRQMTEEEASALASDIATLNYRHKKYWREREQGG